MEYNNWGVFYYKTGDYKEAVRYFRLAVQMKPKNFVYYKNLAFALDKSGQKKEAVQAFKASLNINMDQPEIKAFMEKHGLKENGLWRMLNHIINL